MITIYKFRSADIRAIVEPDVNSQEERAIMGQHIVSLSFSLPYYIRFATGDYATVFGSTYKLNTLPSVQKIAGRNYQYSLTLEGEMYDLGKVQFLFLNDVNQFTEGKFFFNGTAYDFLRLLMYNVERVLPNQGWKIGFVVESGYKNLEFNGNNCLEVLNLLAEAFETEFLIEGKTINLYKKQSASGIVFKYGKDEALLAITKAPVDNSNKVTRLYAYGSDKNIGSNYRNGAQRLRMADSLFVEKGGGEVETVELTEVFEDIFPHREGQVTSVSSPFVFSDATIDFNVNDFKIPGETPKVTFNTGMLAGWTFESSFNNATKTFTISKNTDEQTVDIPSDAWSPAIGDKYVIVDALQPVQYIEAAESLLYDRAAARLDELYKDKSAFQVASNPLWFKLQAKTVSLGQMVGLQVPEMDIDQSIRLVGYTRNLRKPDVYTFQLADTIKQNTLVKLINGI